MRRTERANTRRQPRVARPPLGASPIAAVLLMLLVSTTAAQDLILREGGGMRREALNAMELKPLKPEAWNALADWANGDPVDITDADGNVVVFVTWSSFLSSTMRPFGSLNRLHDQFADRGLIIVGVHHPEAWDDAQRQAERRRLKFPIARDNGGFRKSLMVDQDPDFYIVDRAGQLRYADVDVASLERAVESLVSETSASAETFVARRDDAEAQRLADAKRSRLLRQSIDLTTLPDIPFNQPSEDEYNSVDWPRLVVQGQRRRGEPEEIEAPAVTIPTDADWSPPLPSLDGKLRVVYLWQPVASRTSGIELFDIFDGIQAAHKRDLVVLSVATRFASQRRGNEDAANNAESMNRRFRAFRSRKPLNHPLVNLIDSPDAARAMLGTNIVLNDRRSAEVPEVIYLGIIDSSGKLRWAGQSYESFRGSLARMLRDDPGVVARRAAEEAYIRELGASGGNEAATDDNETSSGDATDAPTSMRDPSPRPRRVAAVPTATDAGSSDNDGAGGPERPADALYAQAAWPQPNGAVGNAKDLQGTQMPAGIDNVQWVTDEPEFGLNERVLVLDFWATWCPHCKASAPILEAAQAEHTDTVAVISVGGMGEPYGDIEGYVEDNETVRHHVYDGGRMLARRFLVRATPHVAIVSTDGVVRWQGDPRDGGFPSVLAGVVAADPLLATAP
ncbi:MAG: TlpA family protein disulfide reductase [Planctomycetota bacterium]